MSKTALVTGGSRGIGYALAEELAKRKYNLFLVALNQERLQKAKQSLSQEYQVNVETISLNLASPGAAEQLYEQLNSYNIDIDVLINNAGFGNSGPFHKTSLSDHKQMIRINITTVMELTHLFLNDMQTRNEATTYIMNVASTAAFQPGPDMALYYATKSFVYSLTEAIGVELANESIHICTFCPGPTSTDFHETAGTSGRIINNSLLSMDPGRVANIGIKKMFGGKSLIIPGLANKLGAMGVKLLPRSILLQIVQWIHKSSE